MFIIPHNRCYQTLVCSISLPKFEKMIGIEGKYCSFVYLFCMTVSIL